MRPETGARSKSAENVPIAANDLAGLVRFAREQQIDLTVIGPDDPLAAGVVDLFEGAGLRVFGPNAIGGAARVIEDLRERDDAEVSHPDGAGRIVQQERRGGARSASGCNFRS